MHTKINLLRSQQQNFGVKRSEFFGSTRVHRHSCPWLIVVWPPIYWTVLTKRFETKVSLVCVFFFFWPQANLASASVLVKGKPSGFATLDKPSSFRYFLLVVRQRKKCIPVLHWRTPSQCMPSAFSVVEDKISFKHFTSVIQAVKFMCKYHFFFHAGE